MENKMIEANKVKSHKIPENESGYVHAIITREGFDPETGKAMHKPYIQIFDIMEWHRFLSHLLGMTVKSVLHLPKGAMTPEAFKAKAAKAKK